MRLLLVEDEVSLAKAIKVILKKNNFSVDVVYDGLSALDYISYGSYDGVILDIMLPKMDGITVLKKAREKNIKTPILMLTAKSEIDDKVKGLDCGANDYLTKPFDIKELLARIRAMLRLNSSNLTNVLTFGNVVLDTSSFVLSSKSGSYRLSNKEYQLLELFLRNPKHTISSEEAIEKIYGFDGTGDINTLWVYISYLRKKLKVLNANFEIKSNRNLGYYLEKIDG